SGNEDAQTPPPWAAPLRPCVRPWPPLPANVVLALIVELMQLKPVATPGTETPGTKMPPPCELPPLPAIPSGRLAPFPPLALLRKIVSLMSKGLAMDVKNVRYRPPPWALPPLPPVGPSQVPPWVVLKTKLQSRIPAAFVNNPPP